MAEKYEILEEKILQAIENYDPDEIIEICSKMSDEEIKKVFDNSSIFDVLEGFEVVQICSKMSDKAKKEILYKLSSWCIMKLSQDMSIEDKIEILNNSEILKKLLGNDIAKICETCKKHPSSFNIKH